jgi:amidase
LAAMPLTYIDFNGRPIGLMAAAPDHREDTLIKLMSAFESSFPARKPPTAYKYERTAN